MISSKVFSGAIYTVFSLHPVVSIIKAIVNNNLKKITIHQAIRQEINYDCHLVVNFKEFMNMIIKSQMLSYELLVYVQYDNIIYYTSEKLTIEDVVNLDKTINNMYNNLYQSVVNYGTF